jgi:hypothetical protein
MANRPSIARCSGRARDMFEVSSRQ